MKHILTIIVLICIVALSQQVNATNCSVIFKTNGYIVSSQSNQTLSAIEIDENPPNFDAINRIYIYENKYFIDTYDFIDKESEGFIIVDDVDFIEESIKYENNFKN